jgi:iron complex outermembrane receptor protein
MHELKEKPVSAAVRLALLAAGIASITATAPAVAQTAGQSTEEASGLDEIIVTARFREEKLQETPIAITAITADELSERAMQSAYEVAYTVPNASLRPTQAAFGASMSAYIRGIGQYDFLPEFEPGVAIYFDDILHPVTFASQIDLMDLERVEVLRGPQGTLFGRGSIGGAIRYVSKAPTGDDTGNVQVTFGDYNRLDIRASYDFGLTDTISARITGVAKKRDGYQTVMDFACRRPELAGYGDGRGVNNTPVTPGSAADTAASIPRRTQNRDANCVIGHQGGQDLSGGRAAIRFAPSDQWDLTLTADYMDDNSEAAADTLVHIGRNPMSGVLPGPFNAWSNTQVARTGVPFDERFIPESIYHSYATYQDPVTGFTVTPQRSFEQQTLSAKANIHISEDMLLEIIASDSDFDGKFATDSDQSPFSAQLVDGIQTVSAMTFETRLSGTVGDRFDWTLGAFYYDGEFTNAQQVSIPAFVPTALLVNGKNTTSSENLSGFGHGVFRLNDKLSLTAGVRYSTDEKGEVFDNSIVQANLTTDESHFDWKAGIDYKFTDAFMAYASAATSYRPQAFNPRPFQVTQFVGVDGEEATSYEIGLKSDLLDNRLRINVAAFYVDYNQRILPVGGTECTLNAQGEYNLAPPGTPNAPIDSLGQTCVSVTSRTFYNNIPATIDGAELEVQWVPIDGLTISGVYGFTDFQGDEFDEPGLLGNPLVTEITSDNPIYVPEDNWSVSLAYKFGATGERGTFTPRIDYYGQSDICFQIRTNISVQNINTTEEQGCAAAYELLNARIEWASPEDTWRIALGATNLTEEEYFLNKFDLTAFGQPTLEGQPGAPREWYVQFTRNFN